VDAAVAEQAVYLFHSVPRFQAGREGQRAADGMNAKGGTLQDADGRVREGGDPFGVKVVCKDRGYVVRDAVAVERMISHCAGV
jgi:hypothetical protein